MVEKNKEHRLFAEYIQTLEELIHQLEDELEIDLNMRYDNIIRKLKMRIKYD